MIDLLQGRVPRSIFLRHYYKPNFEEECERIRGTLAKLRNEID